ncbi:site-specific integrase [Thalassotalea sp. HSM 43]|uniref:tyrosine-type recombinase/integrase n=1 Tax=Thalassotalea sp. HSM 43 TaxID=2552945 RepID=UPI0010819423|nr:site-specific integrase [Thalassotalea sp. HSM 43]QBY02938.1 site-specific integrase [Thalassotalea sp. HSM 43]
MKTHNPNNVRIIHKYCMFLKEAKRQNEASIDGFAKAINRFEQYTKYKDFKKFHYQQAVGFKKHLANQKNATTKQPLSKATLHTTLRHLKSFFQWLAMQTGYKSRINYCDTEYFNLSEKETRIANAKRKKPVPSLEQILHVLEYMPERTDIEKRNKALIAFTLLTGARDSAIASLKIKHVNLLDNSLFQDARDVNTKFSKTFTTYFFPVGNLPKAIVSAWIEHLTKELLFSPDDPLFPKTKMVVGSNRKFQARSLLREHWLTADPIRKVFKQAFQSVELPYFNPHSFRNTLVRLGEKLCQTPEAFKAWSQNLGHEGVLTTLYSYGEVADYRQAELIKKLNEPRVEGSPDIDIIVAATIKQMKSNKQ